MDADLIVVGLGAMGAAVTFHGTEQGLDVIGIDRHDPPHQLGSTSGETRITRLAVGEGPQYLPFVKRAHEIWGDLEARTGVPLFHQSGGCIVTGKKPVSGQRWEDFVLRTAAIATEAGIDYEVLSEGDARQRHPWIRLPDGRHVGFEPSAGLLMADNCVDVQLQLARAAGARLHPNTLVERVVANEDRVTVTASDGRSWQAQDVVLAAGPWMPDLAHSHHRDQLTVTRQVVFWFEADDPDRFTTQAIPFVMWVAERDEDYVCLFPTPPGGTPAVKLLSEQFLTSTTAQQVDRDVSDDEIRSFHATHVAPHFTGVSDRCVRAEVCLYTNTSDDHFLIEASPDSSRVVTMSPCSGHGFKHSTALAEAVVQRVVSGRSAGAGYTGGSSSLDLNPFRSRIESTQP